MKVYCLAVMFFVPMFCAGQIVVGEVNINAVDSIKIVEVYINRERAFRNFVNVFVDYGQKDNFYSVGIVKQTDNSIVEPGTKTKVIFKSTAAVLNFFQRNNWEYFDGFADGRPGSTSFYYYFRKKE